jgi:uncharacterized membrane protein
MTIGEWLERREPRPPAPLMGSLLTALGSAVNDDARESASVFLVTAEQMLRELVGSGQTGRATADALLTIDALTTYALESAAETIQSLPAFSDDAIARFADLAAPDVDASGTRG